MTRRNPVRLHKNGDYWTAAWRDDHGVLRRKNLGHRADMNRNAALAACQELTADMFGKRSPETLGGWSETYREQHEHLAPSTQARYKAAAQWACRYFGETARLDAITPASAAKFVSWLREQKRDNLRDGTTLAPSTVWGIVAFVQWWFGQAVTRRMIPTNPFEGVRNPQPKVRKEKPYVTHEQIEKVLEACPDASWRCLFGLARLAGLRAMEAMSLEVGHVDWEARTLAVWPREGVETTKQGHRVVPVSPRLYGLLRECYESMPEGQVAFCWNVQKSNYLRDARKVIRLAGFDWSPPLHSLRASLETDWMGEFPAPAVCKWLGHDVKIAMTHYVVDERFMAGVTGRKDAQPVAG